MNADNKTVPDVVENEDMSQHPVAEEVCVNEDADEKVAQLENVSKGVFKSQLAVLQSYFHSGANYCVLALVVSMFILTQILASGYDFWMSYW